MTELDSAFLRNSCSLQLKGMGGKFSFQIASVHV